MCGIVGIYNTSDPEKSRITARFMADQLCRRGPDNGNVEVVGNTVFAHRRLSIIDLDQRSNQPMISGNTMITFNGEIYNFREIRQNLEKQGSIFKTTGDTEVILELYKAEGVNGLSKLDGMFAFAIFDRDCNSLILMRDRLGKKPLYYFVAPDGSVVFASTLQALKVHEDWQNDLNEEAVRDFLALSYIPHNKCVFKNVCQLPPATQIIFDAMGKAEFRRYWQIDYQHKLDISFEDASEILQKKLYNAVEKRLIADVPCGIFLSGGVDSAAVAALAAMHTSETLHAYTLGFNESKYDERALAATTVNYINNRRDKILEHHTKIVDCQSFELLQELVESCGEPFADFSLLPSALLSKFAAENHKLVLSGDGSDEIFGGYERYIAMRYCAMLDTLLPAPLRRLLAKTADRIFPDHGKRSRISRLCRFMRLSAAPEHLRYIELMAKTTGDIEQKLFGERLQSSNRLTGETIAKALLQITTAEAAERYAECDLHTYLPDDILVKADRASMHFSLEIRSPFLDKDVVEFAAKLPFEFKQKGCERKRVLKRAVKELISPEVANARKRGFAVPIGEWFRSEWKGEVQKNLLEGKLISGGWI
ncbi:MAG: asparagine synthase (glutamine-hydrolyzing), partial [Lentisphaeria bacterium]|nr:asparagine synthase (glutamine-hydrolyzing) [Lentisphaeria bacterium]